MRREQRDAPKLFQDGGDNGKWCAAADPFTVFSYPMVHLVNSPQPPRFLWCHEDILILIFWWLGCGCSFWCELKFFLPWGYCMCCEVISFAMRLFFLSLVFFFLRWVFFFLPWVLFFLPWVFFFLLWVFFFLPCGWFFCRDSCGPPYHWFTKVIRFQFLLTKSVHCQANRREELRKPSISFSCGVMTF